MLDAVDFSTHLRAVADIKEALLAAKRYDADISDSDEEVTRDSSKDPSRSNLDRAKARMDRVGMNIERRLFHAEMARDEVLAINAYSDSSPVTGAELQGMVIDICKYGGGKRRVRLPGASLFYGATDAASKAVAF